MSSRPEADAAGEEGEEGAGELPVKMGRGLVRAAARRREGEVFVHEAEETLARDDGSMSCSQQ